MHLHRNCGNVLFHFKILKGISPPDVSVSVNVEITSRISLGLTDWKEKVYTIMYLLLMFFMLRRLSYLVTILLIGSGFV